MGRQFPLINCHNFPGYFVRKTCPGEKEFPEALPAKDWEGETPSLMVMGISLAFPLASTCSRGGRKGQDQENF